MSDIEQVDQHYEAWGEYRISGIRFFVKGEDRRTHHVHTFAWGSEHIDRHLCVRDYLIAHPQEAAEYATLNQNLAKQNRHNLRGYVESIASLYPGVGTTGHRMVARIQYSSKMKQIYYFAILCL